MIKKREVVTTKDGSTSLFIPELREGYHSKHGAFQESEYIYIIKGLQQISKEKVRILELGFGTGLNAFLTYFYKENKSIEYISFEKYPLIESEWKLMNFHKKINQFKNSEDVFIKLHKTDWGKTINLENSFSLLKIEDDIFNLYKYDFLDIDLVYYDAFCPRVQSDLWKKELLQMFYNKMNIGSILMTYCSARNFTNTLEEIGFKIEKLEGPEGKREIVKAIKNG